MSRKLHHLSKSEVVKRMPETCGDERQALEFFEAQRWGDCPACPHDCGSANVYTIKDRKTGERRTDGRWRCRDCGKQFTVRVGTIMEDSPIALRHWAYAFWCAATAKNGVSALEISRKIQVSYKSALFMMNRIRWAMRQAPGGPKLDGTIEADTTYVGGRPRHPRRGRPGPVRGNYKPAVLAVVERGGNVRTRVFARVNKHTLADTLQEFADTRADLLTDDRGFGGVGKAFRSHRTIKHSHHEYVNAEDPTIHTNTVEGFFSRIKRGIAGVYHNVSREHLFRYADQYEYLYNARKMNDGERITHLVKSADGKRLFYREPTRRAG